MYQFNKKRKIAIFLFVINMMVLFSCALFFLDDYALLFNEQIYFGYFLKIIFLNFLALSIFLFISKKIKINSYLSFAFCLLFLFNFRIYSDSIHQIKIKNSEKQLRATLLKKINQSNKTTHFVAQNLTTEEYLLLQRKLKNLPILNKKSFNIEIEYIEDGFLPDYFLSLIYDLPKNIQIDSFQYQNKDFNSSQKIEFFDNFNRVFLSEQQM